VRLTSEFNIKITTMDLKILLISLLIVTSGYVNAQEVKTKKVNETELDTKKISNEDRTSQEELESLRKENKKLKEDLSIISENEIEKSASVDQDSTKLDPKVTGVEYPDFDLWPSMYFGFSFNTKTRLFKENSPLHLKYGLGLQWSTFRVKGDYVLQKINGQPEYTLDPIGRSLEKSRVRNLHMTLPVMLQFDFSKHNMDRGFKFGVGAYGGVRFYTWQTLKYTDAYGDKVKVKDRNKYFMNPFNYGLQAEIGYGSFSVVGKYDMSPLFDVDNPYDYNAWNLGAKFSF